MNSKVIRKNKLKTKRRANTRTHSIGKATGVKKKIVEKKTKNKQIRTDEAYNLTMTEIDKLMKKGENNLSSKELERLHSLAEAAELYEDSHHPLPLPASLPEIVRMRMLAMQLTQSYAAKLLGVSDTKFSMIMNGKQKPDIYFIKAIHDKLKVNAEQILHAI
jgi:HTH-type transcriptional regulator/antitoxin HigA